MSQSGAREFCREQAERVARLTASRKLAEPAEARTG
jgi:hypothetical protein